MLRQIIFYPLPRWRFTTRADVTVQRCVDIRLHARLSRLKLKNFAPSDSANVFYRRAIRSNQKGKPYFGKVTFYHAGCLLSSRQTL